MALVEGLYCPFLGSLDASGHSWSFLSVDLRVSRFLTYCHMIFPVSVFPYHKGDNKRVMAHLIVIYSFPNFIFK